MKTKIINLVVVTGMSGAGKTVAIQSFEDIGYFTIDNIPPSLVPKVIELLKHSEETDKIALVVDMRSRVFFDEINDILDQLESNEELNFKILFLDATDGELVSRYKETRRSHPLAADGRVLDGIKLERELLSPLKSLSQNVVDTTKLTPRQLRKAISEQFSSKQDQSSFRIEVLSFGFKYGFDFLRDNAAAVRAGPCDRAGYLVDFFPADPLVGVVEVDPVEYDLAILAALRALVAPALLCALLEAVRDIGRALNGRR